VTMLVAESCAEILPGVFRWEIFSPEHRVELTSHAVLLGGNLYGFDPIPLAESAFQKLSARGKPLALALTNENHERAGAQWRARWCVPLWASPEARLELPSVERFAAGPGMWQGWQLEPLPGGAGGELAFRLATESLVVFGDAVINLPGRGLELLPAKYCRDQARLRVSVATLAAWPFERAVFAHGAPILERASERIAAMLANFEL